MRKSSGYKEKLYVHENGLCVSGERIKLSKTAKPQKCYTNKNIRIELGLSQEIVENQGRKSDTDKRRAFKLHVTDYKNIQVCNKQLKQIYETVEIGDFERFLKDIRASDESGKQRKIRKPDILDAIKADEIYEQFFGEYYNYLKNVMIKS